MKIIYTAIFNGYDLPRPAKSFEGFTNILFTDKAVDVEGWKVIVVPNEDRIFRKIKIMPQEFLPKEHTASVWVDGNLTMQLVPDFAVDHGGYWLMRHPDRKCLYQEARACMLLRKDSAEVIAEQVAKYRAENYPENISGEQLPATGVIVRENNPAFYKTSELWWEEVKNHSVRDQISFPYAAWKTGLQYKLFPFMYGFKWNQHDKNRHHQHSRL